MARSDDQKYGGVGRSALLDSLGQTSPYERRAFTPPRGARQMQRTPSDAARGLASTHVESRVASPPDLDRSESFEMPPQYSLRDLMSTGSFSAAPTHSDSKEAAVSAPLSLAPSAPSAPQPPLPKSRDDDRVRTNTITVFGFPAEKLDRVLQHFQQYGDVVRFEQAPAPHGNWMHLQYKTDLAAERALAQNGKIMDEQFMIGVVKSNPSVIGTKARTSIQPELRQRKSKVHDGFVVEAAPKPRSSFCSKLMEYILSW